MKKFQDAFWYNSGIFLISKICFEKYVSVFFGLVYTCVVRWKEYIQKKLKQVIHAPAIEIMHFFGLF